MTVVVTAPGIATATTVMYVMPDLGSVMTVIMSMIIMSMKFVE